MPDTRYFVGIDPGVRTGLCVWDAQNGAITDLRTLDFWGAYDYVTTWQEPSETVVVVEDPALNKPTFGHDAEGARRREKISRNVGANAAEARLMIAGLRRAGYRVRAVRPSQSKWGEAVLRGVAGFTGRSSQHARDAARLVVGLTTKHMEAAA